MSDLYTANAVESKPVKRGGVTRALEDLEKACTMLEESYGRLSARLEGVCIPTPAGGCVAEGETDGSMCAVAEGITRLRCKVAAVSRNLDHLSERVDL